MKYAAQTIYILTRVKGEVRNIETLAIEAANTYIGFTTDVFVAIKDAVERCKSNDEMCYQSVVAHASRVMLAASEMREDLSKEILHHFYNPRNKINAKGDDGKEFIIVPSCTTFQLDTLGDAVEMLSTFINDEYLLNIIEYSASYEALETFLDDTFSDDELEVLTEVLPKIQYELFISDGSNINIPELKALEHYNPKGFKTLMDTVKLLPALS